MALVLVIFYEQYEARRTCLSTKLVCFPAEQKVLYFIEYNAHTSIVCSWNSQGFLAKILFLFFKNNFTRLNLCKFIHHKSHLKPFLRYLPCIMCREYFSIILNVKKCALYLIKYSTYLTHIKPWVFYLNVHSLVCE